MAALLQFSDQSFHHVALFVLDFVEILRAGRIRAVAQPLVRDQRRRSARGDLLAHSRNVVSLVAGNRREALLGTAGLAGDRHAAEQPLDHRRLVLLARGDADGDRQSAPFAQHMDLGRQPAARDA